MRPKDATLVTTSSCHLCEDARETLATFARRYRLDVRIVDAASPEGWALLGRFRPGMLPLLLLDGEMFSGGRLPRKKLLRRLERLEAVGS